MMPMSEEIPVIVLAVGNATQIAEAAQWAGVIDSGPGLSEEDAAKLFPRGYRGTHAGHSHGGRIGLSIIGRLCDLYGRQVYVRPGQARGVVATLTYSPAG